MKDSIGEPISVGDEVVVTDPDTGSRPFRGTVRDIKPCPWASGLHARVDNSPDGDLHNATRSTWACSEMIVKLQTKEKA